MQYACWMPFWCLCRNRSIQMWKTEYRNFVEKSMTSSVQFCCDGSKIWCMIDLYRWVIDLILWSEFTFEWVMSITYKMEMRWILGFYLLWAWTWWCGVQFEWCKNKSISNLNLWNEIWIEGNKKGRMFNFIWVSLHVWGPSIAVTHQWIRLMTNIVHDRHSNRWLRIVTGIFVHHHSLGLDILVYPKHSKIGWIHFHKNRSRFISEEELQEKKRKPKWNCISGELILLNALTH